MDVTTAAMSRMGINLWATKALIRQRHLKRPTRVRPLDHEPLCHLALDAAVRHLAGCAVGAQADADVPGAAVRLDRQPLAFAAAAEARGTAAVARWDAHAQVGA